jgi:rubrerythrin
MKKPSVSARAKIYRLKKQHAEELAEQEAYHAEEIAILKAEHEGRRSLLEEVGTKYESVRKNLLKLMEENQAIRESYLAKLRDLEEQYQNPVVPLPQPEKRSWWRW